MQKRRILITSALPYANGQLHLGHMVEHIQTDIWSRFQNLMGHECYSVCGEDTHGTGIMIAAKKRGITPEELIAESFHDHMDDLKKFDIEYTHYSSTHSEENRKLCEFFFQRMSEGGHLTQKTIAQLYCEHDRMFLPDRFVKGTCPKCKAPDQYGDSCDVCGAKYTPAELVSPACAVCSRPPVVKESEQLLFQLEHFRDFLQDWLPKHTQPEVCNKMLEWFREPLRDWDISRHAPYFGFQIPGHKDKYFYVWVDAPMGYVSATEQMCKLRNLNFDDFWRTENVEVYHNIGKDITYFHTLFWPALLKMAGFRTPSAVFVHGMLMMGDKKMSKSRGTMISAKLFTKHLDGEHMRYYIASKLSSTVDDISYSLEDFAQRVNSDLIGKIANLGSRGAQMLQKQHSGEWNRLDPQGEALLRKFQNSGETVAQLFDQRDYAKAINEIRALTDEANRYFDECAPWKEKDTEKVHQILGTTLNLFRVITIYLKPVVPRFAARVERLFNASTPWMWRDAQITLQSGKLQPFEHLAQRIDPKKMEALVAESQASSQPAQASAEVAAPGKRVGELKSEIGIDQFSAIDLRVALITEAKAVEGADKLLQLKVDLGELGTRQIFAGIKSAYDPAKLIGRKTVIVANLKPRAMKFGMSEGMVLAAGQGGKDLFILSPDDGAKPGDPVQ